MASFLIPNKLLGQITLVFSILLVFSNSFAQITEPNLNLIILLDASGSMKNTDPEGIRKLAAQALVSLLSERDKVSVIEYDSDARILSKLKQGNERKLIFNSINKASDNGAFTDFRAGLEKCLEIFKDNDKSRNIVLLLSDGIFEPNPYDSKYAPYHIQYRMAITGKSREKRREITEQFRKKITPIAKRMIETEILPVFNKKKIEIFSIAFSANSDQDFMQHLAISTSLSNEVHSFYANDATDLMDCFLSLLHYWDNIITLYSEKSDIKIGDEKRVFLDQYVENPLAILLTQHETDFKLQAEGGTEEVSLTGTHPNLRLYPVEKAEPPTFMKYSFERGHGNYRFLFIGKSTLLLNAINLKEKYIFGESIRCIVTLEYKSKDARPILHKDTYINAEFLFTDDKIEIQKLEYKQEGFLLNFVPKQSGDFRIRFTAYVKDSQGKELLPRPSKEYNIKVLPRIYVEPDQINFGNANKGEIIKRIVSIHSGLTEEITLRVTDQIKTASRCSDEINKLPNIQDQDFLIKPGEVIQKELSLEIPKNGCWGDFSGEISFTRDRENTYSISYLVHIPSIWEKITIPILLVFLFIILILIYLAIMWGRIGTPVGIIRFIERPPGDLSSDIYLGRIKRGFLKRFFNWKRHIVTIGSSSSDIRLLQLSQDYLVELRFYRFGIPFISNNSDSDTNRIIKIKDPVFKDLAIERKPGQKYRLKHNTEIIIEDYILRYERI